MGRRNKFELSAFQKSFLSCFAGSPLKNDFYWSGGTALALLHLQHRQSEDIDLFSDKPVDYDRVKAFISAVKRAIGFDKVEERRIFSRNEFFFHNGNTLRVEFVHYDFPPLRKRVKWENVHVDSLYDLAANKTMAMLDRHDPKDAFDVYFLISKKKMAPEKLLALVKAKFDITYPISNFWAQGLLSAQMLENIRPLLLRDDSIIPGILAYYEKGAAGEMHRRLRG